eukprot:m.103828 g.103828  ORF g.103828 m.103828 type:complete len:654 (+) comp10498_c0_seq1:48-2009(+)
MMARRVASMGVSSRWHTAMTPVVHAAPSRRVYSRSPPPEDIGSPTVFGQRREPRNKNPDLSDPDWVPEIKSFYTSFTETHGSRPYHLRKTIRVKTQGKGILTNPLYNKGSAFMHGERDRLGIRGLLPSRMLEMEAQIERVMGHLELEESPIRKYIYLRDLHDRNETLFHRVLVDHMEDLAPVVYTPTVGLACKKFGHDYRRARGMYFCHHDHGDMGGMVYNWPEADVRVIVVTDGSRILGLGDLGANGMGIPIGKLALYCAAGGIAPHRVLPIMFDAGTNNPKLLQDPFYMGLQHRRLSGSHYFELMDEFIFAITARWPNVMIQFEDFSSDKAMDILNRYRDHHLVFNDDIQGTGAVTVAGILSALRQQGKCHSELVNQRIVIAGAGSAGLGVANALHGAMVMEGLTPEEASANFWICDVNGVLSPTSNVLAGAEKFVRNDDSAGMSIADVIPRVKPTILLGLSSVPNLFTHDMIKMMGEYAERPVIFPLSNPTANAECTAEEAYGLTEGRVIFASGSPFDPVTLNGQMFVPSQCNNMFIFPGLGLGATICKAGRITDSMIHQTSIALANSLTDDERARGQIFPSVKRIRQVSRQIAVATIVQATKEGLVHDTTLETMPADLSVDNEDLHRYVNRRMYDPVYTPLVDKVYTTI